MKHFYEPRVRKADKFEDKCFSPYKRFGKSLVQSSRLPNRVLVTYGRSAISKPCLCRSKGFLFPDGERTVTPFGANGTALGPSSIEVEQNAVLSRLVRLAFRAENDPDLNFSVRAIDTDAAAVTV